MNLIVRRLFKEALKDLSVRLSRRVTVEEHDDSDAVFGTEKHLGRYAGIPSAVAPGRIPALLLQFKPT